MDTTMDSLEETRFKKKHSELIQRLSKKLHFSIYELECIFIIYYKIQKEAGKSPGISKVQFRDVMHSAFDMTDDSVMDRIFTALDKGPSQFVSMEIWANALSLFLRGTLEEKMNFCFSVSI